MGWFGNVLWWLGFTCTGIVCQMLVPRIDALLAGLILLLQQRDYRTLLWVLPLFIFLQEGLGTSRFGSSIVWYALIFLLFHIGERFFRSDTFVFVFFLSAAGGAAYYGIHLLMAPLQELDVNVEQLVDASFLQAFFLPLFWRICSLLRPKEELHPDHDDG
ncbi:MAG: hypothetical protein K5657_02350 [Desulfovibrio sp.]|nr:hypothetical protein [Desulfovibrio sp.]